MSRPPILGAIFHEKCIQKSMQNSMTKKYGNVSENVPNMMPKRCPTSMTNLWNFGTCDFLFFVKSITLKSFFYMIRGTRNLSKFYNKSMQIRCSKNMCENHETCSKRLQNESRNREHIDKNRCSKIHRIFVQPAGQKTTGPGSTAAILGGPF